MRVRAYFTGCLACHNTLHAHLSVNLPWGVVRSGPINSIGFANHVLRLIRDPSSLVGGGILTKSEADLVMVGSSDGEAIRRQIIGLSLSVLPEEQYDLREFFAPFRMAAPPQVDRQKGAVAAL